MLRYVITGSIARSASRRYLLYSEANFDVFRPAGTTHCTNGSEIWQRSPPPRQISPHQCNDKGVGPQKLKFSLRFDQNVEYKRPAGAYSWTYTSDNIGRFLSADKIGRQKSVVCDEKSADFLSPDKVGRRNSRIELGSILTDKNRPIFCGSLYVIGCRLLFTRWSRGLMMTFVN